MRFIIKLILIAGLAYAGQLFFPWWVIMAVPFLVNVLIKTKGAGAFFSSFLAIAGLWWVFAWLADRQTGAILTSKIALVLPLKGNTLLLIFVTGFLGGLAGGLAGLTGNAFRNLFGTRKKEKERRGRYGRPDYMYR
jgi:hypothetical protein